MLSKPSALTLEEKFVKKIAGRALHEYAKKIFNEVNRFALV